MSEKIAILDCGGQYTKVIDRKIRELGVNTDIKKISDKTEDLKNYDAFILSGGPASVYDENAIKYNPQIFDLGKPILGICYGFHLINQHFDGEVKPNVKKEYGQAEINILNNCECELFENLGGLNKTELVLMSHGDSVKKIANGFECCAKTGEVVAAIYNKAKKIVAVQFHPEVELTQNGVKMFENFLRKICGLKEFYKLEDRIETSVKMIREKAGLTGKVIVLVSGGVDSQVSAALLLKALPVENIYAIHVDNGFMRKNESDLTCENLKRLGFKNLLRVNAGDKFLHTKVEVKPGFIAPELCEVSEPELKRQIIGAMFIEIVKEAADNFNLDYDTTFIAQGTLRPDLIESGNPLVSDFANKIKTHHNDVDIIRRARERGMIIETNWDWHKDEVRQVAKILGIDEEIAQRQPFPGPGLAVRMICSDNKNDENTENNEIIDNKKLNGFDNFMNNNKTLCRNFKGNIAPIRSVGVQGDARSYKNLAILSGNGLDCNFNELAKLVVEIPNNLSFINRCAYVLNKNNINKLVCGKLSLCKENADLLREIDYIITSKIYDYVKKSGVKISQYFGVLLPISEKGDKFSAVIRAVITSDFMTARAALPGVDLPIDLLREISGEIAQLSGIDLVLYDMTGKPPATVEWE